LYLGIFISFCLQCPEEASLDRNALKLKIGKDLKSIVMHTMQLEELWEQRESQLDRNKRLSTQFFEFEKEIRKVFSCFCFRRSYKHYSSRCHIIHLFSPHRPNSFLYILYNGI